jgi:hypothetical protein
MTIDKDKAEEILRAEAERALEGDLSPEWVDLVEELSKTCKGGAKTHIAFLGTAMLAKATDLKVDVFSVKERSGFPGAYSARGLGHSVLVPNAPALKISLGVTGREPLNNQPYFRISRLDSNVPAHKSAKATLDLLLSILKRLGEVQTEEEARSALRAFIYVRRQYMPVYPVLASDLNIGTRDLDRIVHDFVKADSEGGKRAQAVATGLLDLFAGYANVKTSRINDPSKKSPGDVCVYAEDNSEIIEKSFEIRDKPVTEGDVTIFTQDVLKKAGGDAAVLAVSDDQGPLNFAEIQSWAKQHGVSVTVFIGWENFIEQVLFWSETPQFVGASTAISLIYERLKELEVSSEGAQLWASLVSDSLERSPN